MSDKAVIALGNTFRRDDGIAGVILATLRDKHARFGIDYLDFGTAGLDLINRICDYRKVLLIDGVNAGLAAGALRIFSPDTAAFELPQSAVSSHELDLKTLFEFIRRLELPAAVFVAGIQVADVSFGEGLSEALRKSFDANVAEISRFIETL